MKTEIRRAARKAETDAEYEPISVSIAALVGGDERLKQAHRESVRAALTELEKYTQARLGGNHPARDTGQFIAAIFVQAFSIIFEGRVPTLDGQSFTQFI